MSIETWPNLVTMMLTQADRRGDAPFLWAKREGGWQPVSWRQTAERTAALAEGLRRMGFATGERVVLVSENRPEWLIADFAIMGAGGVTVPAYITNTEADHRHILGDSGAAAAIVSTRRLLHRLLPAAEATPSMRAIITIAPCEDQAARDGLDIVSWEAVVASAAGDGDPVATTAEHARSLNRSDLACIIYTSGTGGTPKGVMLSHGALLHNCEGAADALHGLNVGEAIYLSFLPLSHAYEHTAGQCFPVLCGAQIYYSTGVEHLAGDMREVRPTIMTAVPRLYETMQTRILRGVHKAGRFRRMMFETAHRLGRKRRRQGRLNLLEQALDALADRLVRRKVREVFGGRLQALVSGGAPLNLDVATFFDAIGLQILQGYGLTECGPVSNVNRPGRHKLHTVGPPLRNTEVLIADDGEVLIRGELVMLGYWNNPTATAEVIRDGWLHTGDVGRFDEDGHLIITDRKKDIIVVSGGDNVSPAKIEGMLTHEPEISQAMVYGDQRPHLVALVVPDPDWLKGWARDHQADSSELGVLAPDPNLEHALAAVVGRVNARLSTVEKVRRFAIPPEPFTIDNEQLTPTLKVRRHVVKRVHRAMLEKLYG